MENSIFYFADQFGVQSPFGNWISEQQTIDVIIDKMEYLTEKNQDSLVIYFTVKVALNDTDPVITLHTNEPNSDINLTKGKGTTPLKKGDNPLSIKLFKKSYDTHYKRMGDQLRFYFTVKSKEANFKGPEFTLQCLQMIIESVQTEKSLKTITFQYKSVGLNGKSVSLQMYQQINNTDEIIDKLQKEIKIEGDITSGKISVLESVVINRKNKYNSTNYVLYSTVENIEIKSDVIDLSKDFESKLTDVSESCGIEYRNQIYCVRYGSTQGPRFRGKLKLADYEGWASLLAEKRITESSKRILIAMSENEGNLDGIQGYDDQIVTVGAMQKVIDPEGRGEFATQMFEFSESQPELFEKLFSNCGWTVDTKSGSAKAYYKKITGSELKKLIQKGFTTKNREKAVQCIPIEPLINACKNAEFQAKQVEDFIVRLEEYLNKTPRNYDKQIKSFIKTELGKATVLDQSVNRPNHVVPYFGVALDKFFKANPKIPKSPSEWGNMHNTYESKFLEIYGPLRGEKIVVDGETKGGMTDGKTRYETLKTKLPIQ